MDGEVPKNKRMISQQDLLEKAKSGMTDTEIAHSVGVSAQTLQREIDAHPKLKADIERAKREAFTMGKLAKLPEDAAISEAAAAIKSDIFAFYYKTMIDEDAPLALRKACADALADRAEGKPAQSIEHTGKGGDPMQYCHTVMFV